MPGSVDARLAEADLARLLARVAAGEEIVITRDGQAVARLVPAGGRRPVRFGLLRGRIEAPADFDAEDPALDELFARDGVFPPPGT